MSSAAIYLIERFFRQIAWFIRDWYIDGFFFMNRQALAVLAGLDKIFAVKINLKNLFQPLYQDHSIIGHLLGLIFRLFRLGLGLVFYAALFSAALAIYLVWALVPVILIYKGFF